jgi:hypothetical protein
MENYIEIRSIIVEHLFYHEKHCLLFISVGSYQVS